MNILDIFKSAILVNPDSVFMTEYPTGDYRCFFPEECYITINENKIPFKGRVFQYIKSLGRIDTFWGDSYSCDENTFNDYIKDIKNIITGKNFCPSRFKSLEEEIALWKELKLPYILE